MSVGDRSIRACPCIKDNGEWVDAPTTHRVISNVTRGEALPPVPHRSLPTDGSEALELSRAPTEQENNQENDQEKSRPPGRLIG